MVTENPQDAPQEFVIPTRAEHKKNVRRIWISCICIGLCVMSSMAGMVTVMVVKHLSHQLIVACTTVFFQIIIGGVFTGFTTPYFLETRVNFAVGMEMNRKALQLGTLTSNNLVNMKTELDRLVTALEKIAAKTSEKADDQLENLLKDSGFGEEKPE